MSNKSVQSRQNKVSNICESPRVQQQHTSDLSERKSVSQSQQRLEKNQQLQFVFRNFTIFRFKLIKYLFSGSWQSCIPPKSHPRVNAPLQMPRHCVQEFMFFNTVTMHRKICCRRRRRKNRPMWFLHHIPLPAAWTPINSRNSYT